MAETTRSRAELIDAYPDNFTKDISAEDLRDFVASVDVFGEIKAGDMTQSFGTVAAALVFSADGFFFGTTPDQANNKIVIDNPGIYNIVLQGSVMLQNGRTYEIEVFKNAAFLCRLGELTGDTNVPEFSFGMGCMADLVATDEIQIFVTASQAGSSFDLRDGARVYLERKLGALT